MLIRASSTRHAHPRWSPPLADTDAAIVAVPAGVPRARLQNRTDALASMLNCKRGPAKKRRGSEGFVSGGEEVES